MTMTETPRRIFEIGQSAELERAFTIEDIRLYASVSGDSNPIHLDKDFAEQSFFGQRIVQGMLLSSLLSAILGTRLPGSGAVYHRQELKFKAPVFLDQKVTARVEVTSWDGERGRVGLSTQIVRSDGVLAVAGEASLSLVEYLRK